MLTLSLLGLYRADPELLSDQTFPLPAGLTHEILDPLLLAETAELEILYPDPDTLAVVISAWARARGPAWTRMAAALAAEYNPIHNYDRSESWTEEREGESTGAGSNDRETSSTNTGSSSASLNQAVHGYNSSASNVPKAADTSTGQEQSSMSGTQGDDWNEDRSNSESITRTGSVSGNIGVTTSQQMIQSELELRTNDIYKAIVAEFKTMFCLGVY